jgi:hypothetical protein
MKSKAAIVVTVSVHVHMAGSPALAGISTSTALVGEDYSEVKLAESAVKRYRAAKAGMEVRVAEKKAMEAKQGQLFLEARA